VCAESHHPCRSEGQEQHSIDAATQHCDHVLHGMHCSDPTNVLLPLSCHDRARVLHLCFITFDLTSSARLAELQQKFQKASVNRQRLARIEALGNKFKLEAKEKASQRGGFTARALRRRGADGAASDLSVDASGQLGAN
jgi:hypothetical protein